VHVSGSDPTETKQVRVRVPSSTSATAAAGVAAASRAEELDAASEHLDERKLKILRAIVTEYVARGEPVGSKRVVEVAGLDVSAATVRNEMAALEELGFITSPTPRPVGSRRTSATAGSWTTCGPSRLGTSRAASW
jgi:heat-inducible transcriptional repressor